MANSIIGSNDGQRSPSSHSGEQDEKKVGDLELVESRTTPMDLEGQDKKHGGIIDDTGKQENLHRALTDKQISMIAIGGSIGTGLIIASGTALAQGGPAGLLIGYLAMGAVCWIVITALGEVISFLPLAGFTGTSGRYVDPAAAVALGWAYLFKYLCITPNQINASALLISYWRPDLPGSIFIAVFTVFIVVSNFCGVRFFGHFEYWMSFAKIVILTAIILGGFIISLGANPANDRIGFRYWTGGRAFVEYKEQGALGRFLGVWSTLTSAMFAYLGSELVGVTAGETANPRKALPRAIKMVIFRILVFYIGGVIVIGMLVSPTNPGLVVKGKAAKTAAASPFVLAIQSVNINTLPSIVNAALLVFTLSASNSDLFVASRTLFGLARDGYAPFSSILLRTNRWGVPYVCLTICSLFCALAFMNASSGGATTFTYLTNTVTMFGGIAWWGILVTHIRFMAGLRAQGISRKTLPYAAPFQPYASPIALFVTTIVLLFKGFNVFWPVFDYRNFITNYIGIPVTALIYLGWKFYHKTKFIKASEMDFTTARNFDVLNSVDEKEEISVKQAWKEEQRWYLKPLAIKHFVA